MKIILSILSSMILSFTLVGQCETWVDSPKKDEAENAHVVYRQYIKTEDYKSAFEPWQKAFKIAPAADGLRDWHFKDGIEIYKDKFANETDAAKKEEYKAKIMEMYETAAECIANGTIKYKNCSEKACIDTKVGIMKGRQANDMYYTLLVPRKQTYDKIQESISLAGNSSEYTVLSPYGDLVVYLFQKGDITKQQARDGYQTLNDIADYNQENNETYAPYYQHGQTIMNRSYKAIESDIFDCAFFINKLKPDYELNPTDIENLKYTIAVLRKQGCGASEPFLAKLEKEYEVYAADYNAQKQAEFEASNPAMMANKLYKEEDYQGAISKYQEAIAEEEDAQKKAGYYFSIASIQGRKLNQNTAARQSALKAAALRSGWGRPYMLIGDLYAKSSRTCGNDAYSRGLAVIAAIDKWGYAKSVDSEVAAEASKNISKFSQYLPPETEAFMMGKKAGQKASVDCWIGETVTLRFN